MDIRPKYNIINDIMQVSTANDTYSQRCLAVIIVFRAWSNGRGVHINRVILILRLTIRSERKIFIFDRAGIYRYVRLRRLQYYTLYGRIKND